MNEKFRNVDLMLISKLSSCTSLVLLRISKSCMRTDSGGFF